MLKVLLNYLLAIVLSITIVFIFVSLMSYNHQDFSVLYSSSEFWANKNLCGAYGAQLAGTLLYLFGISSLGILPLIFVSILFTLNFIDYKANRERYFSAILFVFLFCGLCNIYSIELFKNVYPGGLIGILLKKLLFFIFGVQFASTFLIIILLALFIVIDRFSFVIYLGPLAKVINVFLVKIFELLFYLLNQVIFIAQTLSVSVIDKLTKDREEENVEIKDIYNDPFWQLYKDFNTDILNNKIFDFNDLSNKIDKAKF